MTGHGGTAATVVKPNECLMRGSGVQAATAVQPDERLMAVYGGHLTTAFIAGKGKQAWQRASGPQNQAYLAGEVGKVGNRCILLRICTFGVLSGWLPQTPQHSAREVPDHGYPPASSVTLLECATRASSGRILASNAAMVLPHPFCTSRSLSDSSRMAAMSPRRPFSPCTRRWRLEAVTDGGCQ